MEGLEILIENPELGISNFEPLKAFAVAHAETYKGLIVDPAAITEAKADCARLRKLAKTASDMRIKIKKEHEAKIATITAQLTEITGIFNDAAAEIDNQIKAYDELRKAEKQQAIEQIYGEEIGDLSELIPLSKILKPSWLNKSTSMTLIRSDIQATIINARAAIDQIRAFKHPHETELLAAYLERLNVMDALAAKQRIEEAEALLAKRDAEEATRKEAEEWRKNIRTLDEPDHSINPSAVYIDGTNAIGEPEEDEGDTGEVFDFKFSVENALQWQLEALIDFLESNHYTYTLDL